MSRDFIEAFEGPNGRAEVYEVVEIDTSRRGVEKVVYEVICGNESRQVMTMGEASVVACEMSGDPRFLSPTS